MKAGLKTKSNHITRIFTIIMIIILIVSCQPKNEAELTGTYIADYDVAKEKLIILDNGTFIQEVMLKSSGKISLTKGKWYYDKVSGYITFEDNFMLVTNVFGEIIPNYDKPKPGLYVYPANKYFVWIFIGSLEGILYKKIE